MPNGRECTLDHFRPGSIFGEQELILNEDRKATALPRTDVALLVLSRSIVLELQEQVPELVLWMNRSLAASLLRMQNRVESMVFKSAHGNIAEVLVDLARIHGRQTPEGVLIDCPITHQEIASQIGSARETVSYAFMEFRAQGLIATRVRHTFVLDMARLQQIAAE
jgi:CRP-like cAMP-binding protein